MEERDGGEPPIGQMAILGGVFFCVFLSYDMMQGYAAQLYGSTLAADCEAALYTAFAASCLGAPAVVDALGSRASLCVGALCYAALAFASLCYAAAGAAAQLRPLVVAGGVVAGVGASVLWTAQGRVMLAQQGRPGRAFAVFWALFNLSAICGGVLSWAYFSRRPLSPAGEAPLFGAFAALTGLGALGAFALRPLPSDAPRSVTGAGGGLRWLGGELASTASVLWQPALRRGVLLWLCTGVAPVYAPPFPAPLRPHAPAAATARLPCYGSYALCTFGCRFLAPAPLGLGLALYYAAEAVAGALAGALLDARARRPVGALADAFAYAHIAAHARLPAALGPGCGGAEGSEGACDEARGGAAALVQAGERRASSPRLRWPYALAAPEDAAGALPHAGAGGGARAALLPPALPEAGPAGVGGARPATLPTAAGAQRPAGAARHDAPGASLGRAVGAYKAVQSLGWCLGFALSPPERLPPHAQAAAVWLLAALAALPLLLAPHPAHAAEGGGENGGGGLLPLSAERIRPS